MEKTTILALPEQMIRFKSADKIEKRQRFFGQTVSVNFLLQCVLVFFLSKVSLLNDLSPFGLAFLAAHIQMKEKCGMMLSASALLGVACTGRYEFIGIYLFVLFICMKMQMTITNISRKLFTVPLTMFFSILLSGFALNYYQQNPLYDNVVVIFNACLFLISTKLFTYGVPLLSSTRQVLIQNIKDQKETVIGAVIIAALAIGGIGPIEVWGCSIKNLCSCILIMSLAYLGGVGMGAAAGVAVGIIGGLSMEHSLNVIAFYAVGGTMAGSVKEFGKTGIILGFLTGGIIMHLFFTQIPLLMSAMIEIAVAALIFTLLPLHKIEILGKIEPLRVEKTATDVMLAESRIRLIKIAEIFQDLAKKFQARKNNFQSEHYHDSLHYMVDEAVQPICQNCEKCKICWRENCYQSYQYIAAMFQQNVPEAFAAQCLKFPQIQEKVKQTIGKNEEQLFLKEQLRVQQQIIGEQMLSLHAIIENIVLDMEDKDEYNQRFADLMKEKVRQVGCKIEDVIVTKDKKAVQIDFVKACCGKKDECAATIMPIVSGMVKEPLTMIRQCGNEKLQKNCKICLKVVPHFKIQTGYASIPKKRNQVSGDSVKVIELPRERTALVLSDGMGHGKSASSESKMTVECLHKLLKADFQVETAIKIINSLLLVQSDKTGFATVDMTIVNQYNGEVEFIKAASAPTYIKRIRELKCVEGAALPAGMLNHLEIHAIQLKLAVNDFIIMMSDGIDDIKHLKAERGDKEGWFSKFVRMSDEEDPQKLAEQILQQALHISKNEAQDDMSVLVAKIGQVSIF